MSRDHESSSSHTLRRHLSVLAFVLAALRFIGLRRLFGPNRKAPCRASRPFSMFGSHRPFFHSLRSVQHALRCTLEVPPLGFGYPFDGLKLFKILGSLFQLPTLLGFSLRSFFPTGDRSSCFQGFFRSGVFSINLNGLLSTLQRLYPTRLAVPLIAPEGLVRAGVVAPLGFLVS
jgi:hypothetical protein